MFQDYLFFATDVESRYAYRMLNMTSLVRKAQALHKLSNNRALVLAETFLSCTLISSILEDEERFNLRIRHGDQFLSSCETTRFAEVKGFIECEEGAPLVKLIDAGEPFATELHVRTLRAIPGKNHITEGHTVLETDSIEHAINDHMVRSYQMMAELKIKAWIDKDDNLPRAFGIIYMELPNIDPEVAHELWSHVDSLPSLDELHAQSDDPDFLASKLIPHRTAPVRSLTPKWVCTCSEVAVEGMLTKLPVSELDDMIEKAEPVEVKCHYCNQAYVISVDRIRELASASSAMRNTPTSGDLN